MVLDTRSARERLGQNAGPALNGMSGQRVTGSAPTPGSPSAGAAPRPCAARSNHSSGAKRSA